MTNGKLLKRNSLNGVSSTSLLTMVARTKVVCMTGFGHKEQPGDWRLAGLSIASGLEGRIDVAKEIERHASKTRMTLFWTLLMFLVSVLLCAATYVAIQKLKVDTEPQVVAPISQKWQINSIDASGAVISIGAAKNHVSIGGQLPNGETLLWVSEEKQAYTTDRATTVIGRKQ